MSKILDAIEKSAALLRSHRVKPGSVTVTQPMYDHLVDELLAMDPPQLDFPLRWQGVTILVEGNGR
jgi:hypothetical protein